MRSFDQILASALVKHIECVDDWPFFKLSPVVIFLVNLEAHGIGSSLDKYHIIRLVKFFLDLEFGWDPPDF